MQVQLESIRSHGLKLTLVSGIYQHASFDIGWVNVEMLLLYRRRLPEIDAVEAGHRSKSEVVKQIIIFTTLVITNSFYRQHFSGWSPGVCYNETPLYRIKHTHIMVKSAVNVCTTSLTIIIMVKLVVNIIMVKLMYTAKNNSQFNQSGLSHLCGECCNSCCNAHAMYTNLTYE